MSWAVTDYPYGSLSWLRKEVAAVMDGYPKDLALLDNNQRQVIDSLIDGGLFRFYQPVPSELTVADATEAQKERLKRAPHNWSFLSSYLDVSIVSGQTLYDLPSNFNSLLSEPTTSGRTEDTGKMAIAPESHLRQLINDEGKLGYPMYASKRVVIGDGTTQTANKLVVYPIPVENETINIQYSIVPNRLTDAAPWPVSGVEHAQTILACCLAVMEERAGTGATDYRTKEQGMLASSVMLDVESAASTTAGVWPEQETTTLETTKESLFKRIGLHVGFGPNFKAWSSAQLAEVTEIYRDGLRLFCNPPVIPGMNYTHNWSFLTPVATLTTAANQAVYDLPDDLADIQGSLIVENDDFVPRKQIERYGESQIRLSNTTNYTGRPQGFAVRVKEATVEPTYTGDTRYELLIHPVPDGIYTLSYRYTVAMES